MLFLKQLTKTKTLIAILALISLSACSDKAQGPAAGGQTRKPQVSVIDIEPTSQVMITTLQGRTAPYMVAEVRPQVGGILQKRLFDEGAEVKE